MRNSCSLTAQVKVVFEGRLNMALACIGHTIGHIQYNSTTLLVRTELHVRHQVNHPLYKIALKSVVIISHLALPDNCDNSTATHVI